MKRLLGLVFLGAVCVLTAMVAVGQWVIRDLPKLDTIADYKPYQISRVYDAAGNVVGQFYIEKRTLVPIETLPKLVIQAFLAAEDAQFYQHKGVDYLGIFRAVLNEIKYKLMGGQRMGGSTITQQTVKTMLVGSQKTYTRKIKEFILAQNLEDRFSKNEILNIYLNQIYFGNGVYGIEEAAQLYFGKPAKELQVQEAAVLAGIPKSPNQLNPIANLNRSKVRRDYVLDNMRIHGFISESIYQKYIKEPLRLADRSKAQEEAPYFVEEIRRFLVNELGEENLFYGGLRIETALDLNLQKAANRALTQGIRDLDKRQGYRGPIFRPENQLEKENLFKYLKKSVKEANLKTPWVWDAETWEHLKTKPKTKPLTPGTWVLGVVESFMGKDQANIHLGSVSGTLPLSKMAWARPFSLSKYTPLPKSPSQVLQIGDVIWVQIDKIHPKIEVSLQQKPIANGALVVLNPNSRRVVAMVGGVDFKASSYNRATQAKRQSGSAIKPFVYITGFEKQVITPTTLISDVPKVYFDSSPKGQWKPRNNTRKFLGDITVRRCLTLSVNICSITILERIGLSALRETTQKVGLLTPKTPLPNDLTLALGSGEVIPLAFVNAYATFPALGQYAPPVLMERVLSSSGDVLWETPETTATQVVSPQASFLVTHILKSVVPGHLFQDAQGHRAELAGKTGTTNDYRSAWFMGYSQDLMAGVFVGFDDNRSLGLSEYGARAALPIWSQFMKEALTHIPPRSFMVPEGITWRMVDSKTGLLAKATQPQTVLDMQDESAEPESAPSYPIYEAFIPGTEPTLSTSDAPPPPLEMLEGG